MDFSRVLKSDLRVDRTLAACWILAPNSASLREVAFSVTSVTVSVTTGSATTTGAGVATTGAGVTVFVSLTFLATLVALASITTFSTTGAGVDRAGAGVCFVCLTILGSIYYNMLLF